MYERILVPIDGSATADKGLDEAVALARLTGARIRVLHVAELMNFVATLEPSAVYAHDVIAAATREGGILLERARRRVEASGIAVDAVLLDNLAAGVSDHVVAQAKAWRAGLIVIGTHGRRGIGRLVLGSDAETIARTAPVPVLLVRATEGEGAASRAPAHESAALA